MQIIFRGKEANAEEEYVDKFANPFPAAMRGMVVSHTIPLGLPLPGDKVVLLTKSFYTTSKLLVSELERQYLTTACAVVGWTQDTRHIFSYGKPGEKWGLLCKVHFQLCR